MERHIFPEEIHKITDDLMLLLHNNGTSKYTKLFRQLTRSTF